MDSKKVSSEKKYMFEFYCFINFKMQNGASQAKFQDFGSRGI